MAMLLSAFAFAVPASGQDDNVTVVIDENFDSFTEGSEDAPATTDIGATAASSINWVGAAAVPRSMKPAANSRLPVRELSRLAI